MKRSALNFAWLLLGVLAIAAVLLTLGKRDNVADPRIASFGPSGFSAFAQLLRDNGYQVVNEHGAVPRLTQGDVAICAIDPQNPLQIGSEGSSAGKRIAGFLDSGGRAILLPIDSDFSSNSQWIADSDEIVRNDLQPDMSFHVRARNLPVEDTVEGCLPDDFVTATIWGGKGPQSPGFAALTRAGKGTVLTIADGYLACNRFVDKLQNADALMTLVSTLAPKGSRLVFAEGTYTNEEPGLMEILGPGATGAWYQLIFLFAVIIYTLGKRFGLPEEFRPAQTGQRELVEAIADTYRRAHSTRVACRSAYDRADLEVRKALKLASDAPASERDLRIPPELATEFRRTFEGTIDSLSDQEAFARCRSLRRQVRSFLKRT